jgi:hypothetical protein
MACEVVIPRPGFGRHLHPVRAGARAFLTPRAICGVRALGMTQETAIPRPFAGRHLHPVRAGARAFLTPRAICGVRAPPVGANGLRLRRSCSAGGDLLVGPRHRAASEGKADPSLCSG